MDNNQQQTSANMGKRVVSALIILIVLAGFICLRQIADSTVFLFDILIGFMMIIGTFEVENILRRMDRPDYTVGLGLFPVMCFLVLVISALCNFGFLEFLLLAVGALVLLFAGCLIFGFSFKKNTLKQMYKDDFEGGWVRYVFQKSANTVFGAIYPTFLLCFMFLINHFELFSGTTFSCDIGLFGIILLFATTMFADTTAMLSGRLIKSKKISLTKLGPGKSWSGFVGGIVGAIVGAIVVFFIFANVGYGTFFTEQGVFWWQFLIAGLLAGLFNMCGDIVASYLKRRAVVKDFGDFIPGHGGLMDRINGLVFNCVFIFLFLVIIFLA